MGPFVKGALHYLPDISRYSRNITQKEADDNAIILIEECPTVNRISSLMFREYQKSRPNGPAFPKS